MFLLKLMIDQLLSEGAIFHSISYARVLFKQNNMIMYLTNEISLPCGSIPMLNILLMEWIGDLPCVPQEWCDFSKPQGWSLDASG